MKIVVPTIFLLLLFFTAISVDAETENKASQIFNPELARKVLGAPVIASLTNKMNDTHMGKIWVSNAAYSANGNRADVLIRHASDRAEALKTYNRSREIYHGENLSGFADAAFFSDETTPRLNILKGQNWIIITVRLRVANADKSAQKKLASEILPLINF